MLEILSFSRPGVQPLPDVGTDGVPGVHVLPLVEEVGAPAVHVLARALVAAVLGPVLGVAGQRVIPHLVRQLKSRQAVGCHSNRQRMIQ